MKKLGSITVLTCLGLIVLSLIFFGTIDHNKRVEALKNSDSVAALITKITPGRDQAMVEVKYTYKGTAREAEFVIAIDSFKIGDKILLKVSKAYPEKYVDVVCKIKLH
jgi:hypothetical protein